jgi:hypothetical protein
LYGHFVAAKARVASAQEKVKRATAQIKSAKSDIDKMKAEQLGAAALAELKESKKLVVRAAPAWASAHNYGLAMDVLCYSINNKGKLIEIPGSNNAYDRFANIAAMYGVMWPNLDYVASRG